VNSLDFASFSPSVAALSDGGFVVAFQDTQNNGLVSVVRFAAGGERLGFRTVAGTPARPQTSPSVASLDTGGFIVAWNANGDVQTQAFDLALNAVGGEFTVDLPD